MMKKLFLVFVLGLLAIASLGFADAQEDSKVDAFLMEKLNSDERIRTIVNVRDNGEIPSDLSTVMGVMKEVNEKHIESYVEEAFVAWLDKSEVLELSENENVFYIEDVKVGYPVMYDAVRIVDADNAWDLEIEGVNLDGAGVSVCVIDSGVEFGHADLFGKNAMPDNTQLTCPDDLFGTCTEEEAVDTLGHGTHVAGILGADGVVKGVAKGVKIISLRVFSGPGDGATALEINNALKWCRDHVEEYNIAAVSISIGTPQVYGEHCTSGFVENRIRQLADDFHIASVISTGNGGRDDGISWPACSDQAIPVAGTNKDDTLGSYSNYKEDLVRIFAPGTNIESTCKGGGYCFKSGTSMSAPMVAGAVAIYNQALELKGEGARNKHPKLEIEPALFESGERIIDLSFDNWRRLNVFNSVKGFLGNPCAIDVAENRINGIFDFETALREIGICKSE